MGNSEVLKEYSIDELQQMIIDAKKRCKAGEEHNPFVRMYLIDKSRIVQCKKLLKITHAIKKVSRT